MGSEMCIRDSNQAKQEAADAWKDRIRSQVLKYIAAGRSDGNIGRLLASNAERAAGTVEKFAAEERQKERQKKKSAAR